MNNVTIGCISHKEKERKKEKIYLNEEQEWIEIRLSNGTEREILTLHNVHLSLPVFPSPNPPKTILGVVLKRRRGRASLFLLPNL